MGFEVAGMRFALSSDRPLQTAGPWRLLGGGPCPAEPTVTLHVRYSGAVPEAFSPERLVFDAGGVWAKYRSEQSHLVAIPSPGASARATRVAQFSDDYRRGDIWCVPEASDATAPADLPDPLAFPLWEILLVCLLARGRGLMVHASGVVDDGRGYVFAGNSGHGKSTMARLWEGEGRVLHDDRIILRRGEDGIRMYPTLPQPCAPDAPRAGAPLEKVFFLRHDPQHRAVRLSGASAVSRLLAGAFPPAWDARGMAFSLDFCAAVVESVPCFDLGFAPEPDVRDLVRCVS